MRRVEIDSKWSADAQDVLNGVKEEYQPPQLYRYGEPVPSSCRMSNAEIAMVQRIMKLEDQLGFAIEALIISAESGSICSDVSEKAIKKIDTYGDE